MIGKIAATAFATVMGLVAAMPAHAEWKPTKPITLLVAFATGGGTDLLARAMAQPLQEKLGQPIIVLNKPGAAGRIGSTDMAAAAPDGYTFGFGTADLDLHNWQEPGSVSYKSFEPIALINADPQGFEVRADSKYKTLAEALEAIKANPGNFNFTAGGAGGIWHVGLLKLLMSQGINPKQVVHVPTGGGGPALTSLLVGDVDFTAIAPAEAAAMISSGKVRTLAVLGETRVTAFPDIPTVNEAIGQKVYNYGWRGFLLPKGTPKEIVEAYTAAVKEVFNSPQFRASVEKLGFNLAWKQGDDFSAFMKSQYDTSGEILQQLGLAKQ